MGPTKATPHAKNLPLTPFHRNAVYSNALHMRALEKKEVDS